MTKITVSDANPLVVANIVPCKIQYSGECNSSNYFSPTKKFEYHQDCEMITANFRGMKLIGEKVDIGSKTGYICNSDEFMAQDVEDPTLIETRKQFTSIAKFDELLIFGHDEFPSSNNKWTIIKEMDAISDAIHT